MSSKIDMLSEIKRRWSPEVDGDITDTDIEWLFAEIERLRAALETRGPYCAQHGELQPCSQHNWARPTDEEVPSTSRGGSIRR
jgi:hypothetical protein